MIVIDKWPGLVTNASPYSLPPGAAVTQVNLQILSPGQIALRPGMSAATFSTPAGSTSPIRSAMRYPGSVESIIFQDSAGAIHVAKGPS